MAARKAKKGGGGGKEDPNVIKQKPNQEKTSQNKPTEQTKKMSAPVYDESSWTVIDAKGQEVQQEAFPKPKETNEEGKEGKMALVQPPQLSYIERKKLRNNMKMTLVT